MKPPSAPPDSVHEPLAARAGCPQPAATGAIESARPTWPRIGSVSYLNALPLTCGIEERVRFTVPSRLAELLRQGDLDVALVSITEALANRDYQVVDGVAIASAGPVRSVLLAHRVPLARIQEVHCDPGFQMKYCPVILWISRYHSSVLWASCCT